ncbi:MAG: LysR family transcriptional regulator, partial [Myxococcota bacterium]
MDWNDLQTLLAVTEHDGLKGAAKALGVHATTVSRRVREIEERQQTRLFERYRHGVVLTEAGADALAVAGEMRELVDGLSARLQGRDTRLSGTIRVTAVDSLLRQWMPHFTVFQSRYPDIQLELASGMVMANLTRREADVAIRIAWEAPEHLVGSRLCDVAHAVYGSEELLARHGAEATREDLPWVAYDLAVFRGVDAFLATRHPRARVVMRVPRIDLLVAAIDSGVGIGILNCHAGDAHPRLRRIGPADAGTSRLWVLTHPELRGTARISAFTSFMRQIVRE